MNCIHCNSPNIVKKGIVTGKQRYKCKDCGKTFSVAIPQNRHNYDVTCPKCGHNKAKKGGFTKDGRQYYICKNCNHKFTLKPKYEQTSKQIQKDIAKMLVLGYTREEIKEKYNVNTKVIYNIETKVYPKEIQNITSEQIQTIGFAKRFGIDLEYVARYVPCSIHTAKYISESLHVPIYKKYDTLHVEEIKKQHRKADLELLNGFLPKDRKAPND